MSELVAGVRLERFDVRRHLEGPRLVRVEVRRVRGRPVDPVRPEVDAHDFVLGIEQGDVPARLGHRDVDEVLPGVDRCRDLALVDDPSDRSPVLADRMLVAGIPGLVREYGFEVLEVRDLGQVELLEQVVRDHLRDVRAGRDDDVVPAAALRSHQLRDRVLVRRVGVDVGNGPQFVGELLEELRVVVRRPVEEVQRVLQRTVRGGGARGATRSRRTAGLAARRSG